MIGTKGNKKTKKLGKTFNEKYLPNVSTKCGTIDGFNLKSIYMYFEGWTTLRGEDMEKMNIQIKRDILSSLDPKYFNNQVAIDIVECTNNSHMRRPYCHLEYNLFVKKNTELEHIIPHISDVQDLIYKKYYENKTEFITKNAKTKQINVGG